MMNSHITHDEDELDQRRMTIARARQEVAQKTYTTLGGKRRTVDELDPKLESGLLRVYVENCSHNDPPSRLLSDLGKHGYYYTGWAMNGKPGDDRAIFEFQIAEAFQ